MRQIDLIYRRVQYEKQSKQYETRDLVIAFNEGGIDGFDFALGHNEQEIVACYESGFPSGLEGKGIDMCYEVGKKIALEAVLGKRELLHMIEESFGSKNRGGDL